MLCTLQKVGSVFMIKPPEPPNILKNYTILKVVLSNGSWAAFFWIKNKKSYFNCLKAENVPFFGTQVC